MRVEALGHLQSKVHHKKTNVISTLGKQSFGYLVNSKQAQLINYLGEKAPKHKDFYGNQIIKNMKKSDSSSFVRDFYMNLAIAEAKILKFFESLGKAFKK